MAQEKSPFHSSKRPEKTPLKRISHTPEREWKSMSSRIDAPSPFLPFPIFPTFEGREVHPCKVELAESCSVARDRGAYVRFSLQKKGQL